jgi:hypothetical protein
VNLDRRVASLRWQRISGHAEDKRVESINGEEPMTSEELTTNSQ